MVSKDEKAFSPRYTVGGAVVLASSVGGFCHAHESMHDRSHHVTVAVL
jgi:hypothetical protein